MSSSGDTERLIGETARALGVPVPRLELVDGLEADGIDGTATIGRAWEEFRADAFDDGAHRALVALCAYRAHHFRSRHLGRSAEWAFTMLIVAVIALGLAIGLPGLLTVALVPLACWLVAGAVIVQRSRRTYYAADTAVLDLLGRRAALGAIIGTADKTPIWSLVPSHSRRTRHISKLADKRHLPEDPVIKDVADKHRAEVEARRAARRGPLARRLTAARAWWRARRRSD